MRFLHHFYCPHSFFTAVLLSLMLFALSLPLPAFGYTFDGQEIVTGWMAFTWVPSQLFETFRDWDGNEPWMGWTNYLCYHVGLLYWLPNALFLLGLILALARRPGAAAIIATIGFLIAAWDGSMVWLHENECGSTPLGHPLFIGYYVWLTSLALLAVAAVSERLKALCSERAAE